MGGVIEDLSITAIIYVIMATLFGVEGLVAAVVEFILEQAVSALPSFLKGSTVYIKQYYYVGTSGTHQLYSKYLSKFYLDKSYSVYANAYHVDLYYKSVFYDSYYYTK